MKRLVNTFVYGKAIDQCIAVLQQALEKHDKKYPSNEGYKLGHGYRESIKLLQALKEKS
jgi:hypothetical protein